jgi:hypothetical protein
MYNTISLFSQPYYDPCSQCYYNIITMNLPPRGPLLKLTRRVKLYPLSHFKFPGNCTRLQTCGLGLRSLRGASDFYSYNGFNTSYACSNLMTTDEIPDLFSFLLSHGYKVDTEITKMMNESSIRFQTNNSNELIALITYPNMGQQKQQHLKKK